MDRLMIPPAPNWFESSVLACAPDNTVVYGAWTSIVILKYSSENEPANVKIITRAHQSKVLSVDLNKKWGLPDKYCVSVGEDQVVRLWNMTTYDNKSAHDKHVGQSDKVMGANFAGENKVVSVAESGLIVIWQIATNECHIIKNLFGAKVSVTTISCCPHVTWLTAFGLKNGLVVVCDLRKNGRVLYRLRGHNKSIVSLTWCPAPINIFPENPINTVKGRNIIENESQLKNVQEDNGVMICDASEEKCDVKNNGENCEIDEKSKSGKETEMSAVIENSESFFSSNEESTLQISHNTDVSQKECNTEINGSKINKEHSVEDVISQESKKDQDNLVLNYPKIKEEEKSPKEIIEEELEKDPDNIELNDSKIIEKEDDLAEQLDEQESPKNESDNQEVKNLNEEENLVEEIVKEGSITDPQAPENEVNIKIIKPIKEEARKELLLASSGRDGIIYIWRAGTDGRMQTFLTVPRAGKGKQQSETHQSWIALQWISPNVLLSSSRKAGLLEWKLPLSVNNSKPRTIHSDHTKNLFAISGPCVYYTEDYWENKADMNAWTIGQDRLLLNTSLDSTHKNLANYPTVGGTVLCFASSPIDPTRLAIGFSHGVIRVWDLSSSRKTHVNSVDFQQKIQSKVTALAWHPQKETLLAFGTFEGQVGYIDTINPNKPYILCKVFQSMIYKVEWGPWKGSINLYVVSEGSVAVYDISKPNSDPEYFTVDNKLFIYSISWKPDYSVLLVSTKSGSLLIYSKTLELIKTCYFFEKSFHAVVWHPQAIHSTPEFPHCQWFATVLRSSTIIFVYDLATLLKTEERKTDDVDIEINIDEFSVMKQNAIAAFEDHDLAINDFAWDHFDGDRLVSAGDDACYVWDVKTGSIVATYVPEDFCGVSSVFWSPLDPNYIISGHKASGLTIWAISDHPPIESTDLAAQKKRKKKKLILEVQSKKTDAIKDEKSKKVKYNILPCIKPSNFDLETLVKRLENSDDSTEIELPTEFLKLLVGSNEDAVDLLTNFAQTQQEKGLVDETVLVSLWNGDIGNCIKKAIEEKYVTPTMIALAPMISLNLWREACSAYAASQQEKLDTNGLQAATFYLAGHKVEEAINSLCAFDRYREALTLAKCRLPSNDPLIPQVLARWAKYLYHNGNFETAASCYVALNRPEDAAKILYRRTDEVLLLAERLAKLAGNQDLQVAIKAKYDLCQECLSSGKDHTEVTLPSKADLFVSIANQNIPNGNGEKNGANEDTEVTIDRKPDLLLSVANQNIPNANGGKNESDEQVVTEKNCDIEKNYIVENCDSMVEKSIVEIDALNINEIEVQLDAIEVGQELLENIIDESLKQNQEP